MPARPAASGPEEVQGQPVVPERTAQVTVLLGLPAEAQVDVGASDVVSEFGEEFQDMVEVGTGFVAQAQPPATRASPSRP